MATSPEGSLGYPAPERQSDNADNAASESGSSYIGSSESSRAPGMCPLRTADFHDQECSRYFDCPSHIVERSLSDSGAANDADDTTPVVDTTNIRTEDDSDDSEDIPYPRLSIQSDSVVSDSETGRSPILDSLSRSSSMPHGTSSSNVGSSSQPRRASVPRLELPPRTTSLLGSPSISSSSGASSQGSPPHASGDSQTPYQRELEPAPHTTEPSRSTTSNIHHSDGISRDSSEIVLPRWQPDSDVTLCPICRSQFSFFVRKHHCRKCGRVVCNACSPHRIIIPNQYIVRPPGQDGASQLYVNPLSIDRGLPDTTGGERVRLCNPCVPDPNTTPPLHATQHSPRAHYRSQSSLSSGGGYRAQDANTGLFLQSPIHDTYARGRSVTMNSPPGPHHGSAPQFLSTRNQILAGTPPVYHPASSTSHYPGGRLRYLPLRESAGASSSTQRPLPPTPQIAEEDECPVCHRELPSRTLPNHETLRESHINSCISAHSRYGGGTTASTPSLGEGGDGRQEGEGSSPVSPRSVRRTGMFPYLATEKDCVDSAECTICLEEFEVGVRMARLECLCRFHHRCISAWFVNHPGRCPVHQHDSYGY